MFGFLPPLIKVLRAFKRFLGVWQVLFCSLFRYANRAKNIKNKPKINEDPKDALLREFQEEIARLKNALDHKGGGGGKGKKKKRMRRGADGKES